MATSPLKKKSPTAKLRYSPSQARSTVISPDGPTMPRVTIEATVEGAGFSIVQVRYEATIGYNAHGRNDRSRVYSGAGPNNVLVEYGSDILGGVMSARADALIRRPSGSTYWSGWQNVGSVTFTASNPSTAAIIAYLNDPALVVLGKLRSGLIMFDGSGEPLYKEGFGLFQCKEPSAGEIWNWHLNCDKGRSELESHRSAAAAFPAELRKAEPEKYKGLPDYTEEQLKLETYQSFDTGRYHLPKKKGLSRKWTWEKDPKSNGFADRCLALEKEFDAISLKAPSRPTTILGSTDALPSRVGTWQVLTITDVSGSLGSFSFTSVGNNAVPWAELVLCGTPAAGTVQTAIISFYADTRKDWPSLYLPEQKQIRMFLPLEQYLPMKALLESGKDRRCYLGENPELERVEAWVQVS